MIATFILIIAFIVLIIASYTDIKTREVPDWINYALIFAGLGIRAIYSAVTWDWMFFIYGIFGLLLFVALGYLMFYTGQWGGGDSKLLMGLGALIGFKPSLQALLIVFLVNLLLVGAIYGLLYSIALAIIHRKLFIKNLNKILHDKKVLTLRKTLLISIFLLSALVIFLSSRNILQDSASWTLFALLILCYLAFYLILAVKAVELSAMYKLVEPSVITEGDWIAKEYMYKGEHLAGPKDLGISKKQIAQLISLYKKKKIRKIKVKYGIPFVPSFLIAFIMSIIFGPWWIGLF